MVESSAYEVLSVISPSMFLVYFCTTLSSIFHSKLETTRWRYICDFSIVIVPQIFIITVLVPFGSEIITISLFLCICVTILAYLTRPTIKYKALNQEEDRKHFITNVRATTNVLTVIAILAVDFKIFPAQLKKQLKYGYSLMDIGVGLFVYANAIVAPEIKTHRNSLKKSVIDTIPLIVLGVGRYIATRLTDYNVSVTEYGKHWNFFITLAVARVVSSIILKFVAIPLSAICGIVLLIIHETLLQAGLAEYVMGTAKRDNFFSANREGIVSSLGFVAVYFLSVGVGISLNLKERGITSKISVLFKCIILTVVLLPLTFFLESKYGLSRRLANSAYCIWVIFLGVFTTSIFYIFELIQTYLYGKCNFKAHIYVPILYEAINYNGLIYFLLGNILTGLVNMSCETLLVSPFITILILIAYMGITSIVITILYLKKINIKLFISYFTKPKKRFSNV